MRKDFSGAVDDVTAWGFHISDIQGVEGNETYVFRKQLEHEDVFVNLTHKHYIITNVTILVMPKGEPPRIRMS